MSHQIYPESPVQIAAAIDASITSNRSDEEKEARYASVIKRAAAQKQNPILVAESYIDLVNKDGFMADDYEWKKEAFAGIAGDIAAALAATGENRIRIQSPNPDVANG